MLATDPHAFGAHPDSDGALDPAVLGARLSSECNSIIVVEVDGSLVASAGVYRDITPKVRHRAVVWGVYVEPSVRGLGYGRVVMERALSEAASWVGVDRACLSVSSGAPAARQLYESLGFVVWGVEPACLDISGVRYDEIHMQRVFPH